MAQMNLGAALRMLGERESGTQRLDEAVAAWEACLTVAASYWAPARVEGVKTQIEQARAEKARRVSK